MSLQRLISLFCVFAMLAALSVGCDDDVSSGEPISDEDAEIAAQAAVVDALALPGFHSTDAEDSDAAFTEAATLAENLLALAAAHDHEVPHLLPAIIFPHAEECSGEEEGALIEFVCENYIDGTIEQDGDEFDISLTLGSSEDQFTIDGGNLTITEDSVDGTIEILDGDGEVQLVEATFDNVRRDNDDCTDSITGGTLRVVTPDGEDHAHILAVFGPSCDMVQLFDQGVAHGH